MDKKILIGIIAALAISGVIYFSIPSKQTQSGIVVKAWTDSPEYLTEVRSVPPYCENSGAALIKVYSNVTRLAGSAAKDAAVKGQIHSSDGSKFGGAMRLLLNKTSEQWSSDWFSFGCIKTGDYYLNVTATGGNLTASGIYNFAVREQQ